MKEPLAAGDLVAMLVDNSAGSGLRRGDVVIVDLPPPLPGYPFMTVKTAAGQLAGVAAQDVLKLHDQAITANPRCGPFAAEAWRACLALIKDSVDTAFANEAGKEPALRLPPELGKWYRTRGGHVVRMTARLGRLGVDYWRGRPDGERRSHDWDDEGRSGAPPDMDLVAGPFDTWKNALLWERTP